VKLFVISLFMTVSAGFADTIQFTGLPANTQYGTYNGYATATIDGIPSELLICDDFDHTTYVPSGPLDYSVSTLTGADPLQFARFADPSQFDSSVAKYEEAAILLNGLRQTGPSLLLDLTADYQYALWMLFTPSVASPNATAQTLLNDAASSVQQGGPSNEALYSELRIFTPDAGYSSNQEFLQMAADLTLPPPDLQESAATPEPAPAVLIGIGIVVIGLSVGARRLRKRHQSGVITLDNTPRGSER
jgi:hypothetical protein